MGIGRVTMIDLTCDEARKIVWNEHKDWIRIEQQILLSNKLSTLRSGIFMYAPTKKLYRLEWWVGQYDPFERELPNPVEVIPVEKPVIVYEPVKRGV